MSKLNINFNDKNFEVSSSALSEVRADFVSHLGTIAGEGLKIVVNGVEYSVDSTKLTDAVASLEATFSALSGGGSDTPSVITWDGNTEGRKVVDLGEGMAAVKLADFVSKEQIMGATITTSIGETCVVDNTSWNDTTTMFTDELSWNNSNIMLISAHSAETTDGFIPGVYASFEPGLYTLYIAEANMYVSEIAFPTNSN